MLALEEQRELHECLTREFTTRYLGDLGVDKIAHITPFDPDNPVCDYNKTYWDVPEFINPIFRAVGIKIIEKDHRISRSEIDNLCVAPFADKAPEIIDALHQYPLLLSSDHNPDLQSALALVAAQKGIANKQTHGRERARVRDMIKISNGIGTRAIHPVEIDLPLLPAIPFVKIEQTVGSPHLTIPRNPTTKSSSLQSGLIRRYNIVASSNIIKVAGSPTNHPDDLHSLWSASLGGEKNLGGREEHEGKVIMHMVNEGTIKLLQKMGCGVLQVYSSFGKGKRESHFELGRIIPPDEITSDTIHGLQIDQAQFRRKHGEPNVYYAGELDLAT
ncbi:MAG: hypothetical protein AAB914_01320 [Patescibacteria group bacterium]